MAEAVKYLHDEMNIMHRDLQLDNWMMREDKSLVLVDFGCAKVFDSRDQIIEKNDFMFPPSVFCSPE